MKNLFNEGSRVKLTCKGVEINATVINWDYNVCTYEPQYDLLCDDNPKYRKVFGVPQRVLSSLFK